MRGFLALTAAGALACAAVAAAADSPAGPVFAPVAHSALITVDGALAADTLVLRVRRASDQHALANAELSITIDGRSVPVTVRPEGTWSVPVRDLPKQPSGKLSIGVVHDGVREVLDGQLPGRAPGGPASRPAPGAASSLIHKQVAWWILNIVIVLVGVIAVSRRMS